MLSAKIKNYFLLLASLLVIGMPLARFTHVGATSTVEEDLSRRKLAAFRNCLSDQYIDEDDDIDSFNDMWDPDGSGADYFDEKVVVGFELDSTNGVQSCKTAIAAAMPIIEPDVDGPDEAVDRLIKLLTGKENFNTKTSKEDFNANRAKLLARVNGALLAAGPPRRGLTANRLVPLLNLCYDIQDDSKDLTPKDHNFRATIKGKSYFFTLKDKLDDDHVPWVDQGDGSVSGATGENYNTIGDVELGFTSGKDSGFLGSNFDMYTSDFYPFGSDLKDFTGDHRGDWGILDCEFIRNHMDFFTDDVVFEVDTAKDILSICIDTSGNGQCEKEEVMAEPEGLQSSGIGDALSGDDNATCEITGGSALSWVICPLINGASEVVDWVFDSVVVPFLENIPITTQPENAGFQIWSAFRVLANILVVIVLIVVIIGASTGGA